ncbi:hypothetical protein VNO77_46814 [Canavalia gladiata]|uniref:Uncharacterized protein n=1 Tax=Canavalia gladiata TaxID=3824 RepID=A0AAN9PH74_CANGL
MKLVLGLRAFFLTLPAREGPAPLQTEEKSENSVLERLYLLGEESLASRDQTDALTLAAAKGSESRVSSRISVKEENIRDLGPSGPATSTSTTISFEPGKITLYIRYLKLEDSSSYLMIFYLSSGQERSDRGDGRGEEVSTIAMTGKQTGKTRKERPLFRGNMR